MLIKSFSNVKYTYVRKVIPDIFAYNNISRTCFMFRNAVQVYCKEAIEKCFAKFNFNSELNLHFFNLNFIGNCVIEINTAAGNGVRDSVK